MGGGTKTEKTSFFGLEALANIYVKRHACVIESTLSCHRHNSYHIHLRGCKPSKAKTPALAHRRPEKPVILFDSLMFLLVSLIQNLVFQIVKTIGVFPFVRMLTRRVMMVTEGYVWKLAYKRSHTTAASKAATPTSLQKGFFRFLFKHHKPEG